MKGKGNGRGKPRGRGTSKNYNKTKKTTYIQETDKKEMLFMPKKVSKIQGCTCKTVKEYFLNELQKDLEHGEDLATNLRKGEDTRITLEEPTREIAKKQNMTAEEKASADVELIRQEFVKE